MPPADRTAMPPVADALEEVYGLVAAGRSEAALTRVWESFDDARKSADGPEWSDGFMRDMDLSRVDDALMIAVLTASRMLPWFRRDNYASGGERAAYWQRADKALRAAPTCQTVLDLLDRLKVASQVNDELDRSAAKRVDTAVVVLAAARGIDRGVRLSPARRGSAFNDAPTLADLAERPGGFVRWRVRAREVLADLQAGRVMIVAAEGGDHFAPPVGDGQQAESGAQSA